MHKIRHSVLVAGFALLLAGSAASFAAPLPNKDLIRDLVTEIAPPSERFK